MYNNVFNHFEKYETKNMKGLNSATKPYPDWLQNAAAKGKEKLEKYYSAADCTSYVIGTGKLKSK